MNEATENEAEENASGESGTSFLRSRKFALLLGLVVLIGVLGFLFRGELSLAALAEREMQLTRLRAEHPVLVLGAAFLLYVVVTGLSLPGAAVLTLVYGWLFEFWTALVLVSFASTTGATVALLTSRYLFRDAVQSRFGERLEGFNEALDREGAFYLFSLRLVPAVPFFVLNLLMGLTSMAVGTFWWVSQLGMLPASAVYVYAGSTIPTIAQLADPQLLRPNAIRDWPEFETRLAEGQSAEPSTIEGTIWRGLPASTQEAVARNEALAPEEQRAVLETVNDLLGSGALVADEPDEDTSITKAGRDVLVETYPDTVLPPQPLVSWQLLAAFVLLGLFPLAVRKITDAIRGRPLNPADQSDEQS